MAGVQPCAVDRREAAPAVEHDPPVPGRSCSCLAMPTGYTPSPRLLGPRASLTRSSTEGSKAMLTQTPYPVPVNLAAVAAATAASAPSGWMSKKPRATSPASSIANYGRNLEPSLPLEVRERALRELARMLTRIDDRDVASTYEELKRHGITWKLVALISELQASVDNAPAVDSCPSPPSMNGTLLRWCLSCMANLTYFGGADLLKDSGVSGVLNILLFALYSSDPTIQSYAVVGLSNVRRAARFTHLPSTMACPCVLRAFCARAHAPHPGSTCNPRPLCLLCRRCLATCNARSSSTSATPCRGCSRSRPTSSGRTWRAVPSACCTT